MDELLTTAEIAKLLKCNKNYVGDLVKSGLLPYLQIGSRKVRKIAFNEFLKSYEGWDITDPYHPKQLYDIDTNEVHIKNRTEGRKASA
jgi:excisionase family DNA binding protein